MDPDFHNGLMVGIVAGVVGGLGGGLVVLLLAILGPRRKCPECGEPQPKMRKPRTRRQALWGGWTCAECGCEIDRKGRRIEG